ncbi:50S ribosomal protein L10, partial [Candidatus Peregrinibacteria bacterium]|nr:50S ribosomal protein L10 [Candidatus Peregrinibacteria bacterium]
MPLSKDQKKDLAKAVAADMKNAKAVVFADYQGLTVNDLYDLRKELRSAGAKFQVVKKTLMKIAAKDAGFEVLPDEAIEGQVGVAFSMEDELAAAKILAKFAKTKSNLKLRGGLFEGRVISAAETKMLASLPSREELLSKIVYLFKAPISGFHGVLYNTIAGFVRVLGAFKDQKGE